jgi:hypothetical protein
MAAAPELCGAELGGGASTGGHTVTRGRRRPGANPVIRFSMIAVVVGAAIVVGYISYGHAYAVVLSAGETGITARLYPATIDGLVYAASMVLLDSARRNEPAPALAYWMLGAGIAATMAANLAAGWPGGVRGIIVYGWPAPVLVGMYELLMVLIRRGAKVTPGDATLAAHDLMAASVAQGNPLSGRRLAKLAGIDRNKATDIARQYVPAEPLSLVNGNGADHG